MRLLEAALIALTILWPLCRLVGWHRSRVVASVFVLLALTAIAVLLIAGAARWALAPILCLLIVWEIQATATMVGDVPSPAGSRSRQVVRGVALTVVTVPAILVPMMVLPRIAPIEGSGPHMVGVRLLDLRDTTGSAADGAMLPRTARIWFPGEAEADLRKVRPDAEAMALEPTLADSLLGKPWGWTVRGITRGAVEAFTPMRLLTSQRDFPVVILSAPGPWGGLALRRLAVDLASRGFVVVELFTSEVGAASAVKAWQVWSRVRDLAAVGSGDRYAGRLRTDAVGWVGLGRAADVGQVLADSGVAAALVYLDPPGQSRAPVGATPEIRLEREGWPTMAGSNLLRTALPGAQAIDFTDLGRWSPWMLRQRGRGGWVSAGRMEAWVQGWTATFLGIHLTGQPADSLRALATRFPGTTVSLP